MIKIEVNETTVLVGAFSLFASAVVYFIERHVWKKRRYIPDEPCPCSPMTSPEGIAEDDHSTFYNDRTEDDHSLQKALFNDCVAHDGHVSPWRTKFLYFILTLTTFVLFCQISTRHFPATVAPPPPPHFDENLTLDLTQHNNQLQQKVGNYEESMKQLLENQGQLSVDLSFWMALNGTLTQNITQQMKRIDELAQQNAELSKRLESISELEARIPELEGRIAEKENERKRMEYKNEMCETHHLVVFVVLLLSCGLIALCSNR
eukprot:105944_1